VTVGGGARGTVSMSLDVEVGSGDGGVSGLSESTATAEGSAGMDATGVGESDAEASLLPGAAGIIVACKAEPSRSTPAAASSCAQGASAEVEGRRDVEL
jgi:hypothetical protein